jgi:hypothetical protein
MNLAEGEGGAEIAIYREKLRLEKEAAEEIAVGELLA